MTDDDTLTAAAVRAPSRREVTAAFVRAADKARRAKSPSLSWLLSVDGKLLPLLGQVYGNPPQARREFLAQVRAHLRSIDLEMPERAAETEYEGALQAGRLARRQDTPAAPQTTKTWVTMHDERVRPSHAALEGRTLPLDESFDVGGFPGMHPGDWRLPPSERIDCRCHLTFATTALRAADEGDPMPEDEDPFVAELMDALTRPMDGPIAAGLAVVARDTGRVLMLQRAFDPSGEDPAAGTWEFPGGTLDDGEDPRAAAFREFVEETGIPAPVDEIDSWVSPNGVYQLFIVAVDKESDLDIDAPTPDDPDGETAEALAWWAPEDAAQNPSLRAEAATTPWGLLDCGCAEAMADVAAAAEEGVGWTEVAEELLAEATEEGRVLEVGVRDDGAIRFGLLPDDPLDAAIALHQMHLDGTVPADAESQQQMMDLLEAADAERSLTAAGGADRNRGDAERLRRYWTFGEGGQRIRWGTPGDFTRCVAELDEHLGIRAKGYCALRHKEMNGVWPGDRDGKLTASTAEDLVAAGSPYPGEHIYDAAWFMDPGLDGPTPLTIEGSRVYGHVADWNVCHRSFKRCRTAPRSRTGYAQFHVGEVMTSAGPLAVGNLVTATEHASLTMTANAAAQHYADSGTAVAVVRAGEDKHGIWVAGSIIEGTNPRDVATLRRCPLSGDWRAGEMVAALAVNVPGLPIAREHFVNGRQLSMVASGPAPQQDTERLDALAARIRDERLARVYADVLAERVLS